MNAPDRVDHFDQLLRDMVHLARFGAEGRTRDVVALTRKVVSKYKNSFPELAEGLAPILTATGMARGARRPLPVDADTRLALARIIDSSSAEQPILHEAVQSRLMQIVAEHVDSQSLLKVGLIPVKTALLVGPPGVGKTMTARWIAAQLHRPLVVLDLASSISSYLGKSGQNIRQLFDYGKEFECVLLLDEVDAIAKRRSDDTDLGELKRLVNVLLQELDEWPEGGLLLAATNHPSLLDPAIWRRFETVVELNLPQEDERRAFLHRELAKQPGITDALVVMTGGMNFSEIKMHLQRARKASVLNGVDEVHAILKELSQCIRELSPTKRAQITSQLIDSTNLSQRQVSEITGTSRTTMQKQNLGKTK